MTDESKREVQGVFMQMYPMVEPGPVLDLMNRRATTYVRRSLDEERAAQVLEALGLDE